LHLLWVVKRFIFQKLAYLALLSVGNAPSRSTVIEELIHLGQHRRFNWGDVSHFIPHLEIEAQHKLLQIGQRMGWTVEEIERIRRALKIWEAELK